MDREKEKEKDGREWKRSGKETEAGQNLKNE